MTILIKNGRVLNPATDMDEVAENCARAAVISEGRVFACDFCAKLFSRADELRALGLDVPMTAKISARLAKNGIKIYSDFTSADFTAKVIEAFEGGGNA